MLYKYLKSQRGRWMFFTVLCGMLPIVVRFVSWLSAAEGVTSPVQFSDVVFLGLMFNAASAAHVLADKYRENTFLLVIAFALMLSVAMVGVYAVEIMFGPHPVFWACLAFPIFCSVGMSLCTANSAWLEEAEVTLSRAEFIDRLPQHIRKDVHKQLDQVMWSGDAKALKDLEEKLDVLKQKIQKAQKNAKEPPVVMVRVNDKIEFVPNPNLYPVSMAEFWGTATEQD